MPRMKSCDLSVDSSLEFISNLLLKIISLGQSKWKEVELFLSAVKYIRSCPENLLCFLKIRNMLILRDGISLSSFTKNILS